MDRCDKCLYYDNCEDKYQYNFCEDCKDYYNCDIISCLNCCKAGYEIECNNGFEEKEW